MAKASQAHGDMLTALLVAGIGIIGVGWLVVKNYQPTSPPYALAATLWQIVPAVIVFPPLSLFWLAGDSYANRGSSSTQRVRIKPRWQPSPSGKTFLPLLAPLIFRKKNKQHGCGITPTCPLAARKRVPWGAS